jgi:hypothetical protein
MKKNFDFYGFRKLVQSRTSYGRKITDEEASAMWEKISAAPCALCQQHREEEYIVAFIPKVPTEFGGVGGKDRLIFYKTCQQCAEKEGAREEVEEALRAAYGQTGENVTPIK